MQAVNIKNQDGRVADNEAQKRLINEVHAGKASYLYG